MIFLLLLATGCGGKPAAPPASHADNCKESDGPTADTVRQAISAVPVQVPGSSWVEIGRGHTKKCRLFWVQIIPTIASESTPQQLLFFDHNRSLGTPTPNPKPYITVLPRATIRSRLNTAGRLIAKNPVVPRESARLSSRSGRTVGCRRSARFRINSVTPPAFATVLSRARYVRGAPGEPSRWLSRAGSPDAASRRSAAAPECRSRRPTSGRAGEAPGTGR